ncbi:MAG TPA: serine/threonine-protein kinase [Isosphaeraceae bacterium]|nr:serine/threonine-protein kinase [Isosphaeraceae bacterium]
MTENTAEDGGRGLSAQGESAKAELQSNDPPTVRSRPGSTGSTPTPGPRPNVSLPEPGMVVDTFEIQEAIGAGGMGAVFRALDIRLHRLVALKILPPEQATDPEVLQRFYHEGQAAAQLDNENIARVYTVGSDQTFHFIAFEYIEGTTIRQRVEERGPLSVSEAINYTLQIAGALVHAAERGVVHRDIKPSNIIVTPQGRAKLVDMGLARRFERGGDHSLTQSGMTLGTFDYISPEQARDPRDVDVRSDLYSLGCTLFHMLTGRPPFPDGTVLQKLLQHQEDSPPDVRALNPQVPAELGAVLTRLMAKNRERRYQTPELLVRDLLTVAGSLGLRSVSPEGLVWMSASGRPSWEHHLIWALPTAALVAIVGVLLWWGREPEQAPLPFAPEAEPAVTTTQTGARPQAVGPSGAAAPAAAPGQSAKVAGSQPPAVAAAAVARPGLFTVASGEDLARVIAEAPSGSTVVLTDNGPFDLRLSPSDAFAALRLNQRDLTIKAATGVRPVLRLTRFGEADLGDSVTALCRIQGGRVLLEGLEFLVDPGESDEPLDAIQAEGTDLSLRRCFFHSPAPRGPGGRLSALHLKANPGAKPDGVRPAPVIVDGCHFDGGQVGVLGDGPVDVSLRDCTFSSGQPAFWLDNPDITGSVPASLHLAHVSVLAGEGPVFRLSGANLRIRIDDSVVAPPREGDFTLVAAQDADDLDWLGRGNLYAKVGTFLQLVRGQGITRFEAWTDAASSPREVDSVSSNAYVWAEADPMQVEPSRAFRLAAGVSRPAPNVGARRVPSGPIAPLAELAVASSEPARKERDTEADRARTSASEPSPSSPEQSTGQSADPAPMPMAVPPMARAGEGDELPTMPPAGRFEGEPANNRNTAPGASPPPRTNTREPAPREPAETRSTAVTGAAVKPDTDSGAAHNLVHNAQQFLDALNRLGEQGGTIRLAADADFDLATCELRGTGRWAIQAESGAGRPRISFQPAAGGPSRSGSRASLFRLRGGSLELEGIDLVLDNDRSGAQSRSAVFGIWPGTEVRLSQCSVTVAGEKPGSAVLAVMAGEGEIEAGVGPTDNSAASLRASDSLFRSGGDMIDIAAGRRLDLDMTNCVVATSGSLAHGHGLARAQTAEPLKLVLRQVIARVAGGLVLLESSPGEPELPVAEVVARDSIFATTAEGAPLFRVNGQENLDELRDRVRWEGHGVAYHQIGVYRRDQTTQIGTLPVRYDRPSWDVAVAPRDQSPIHGDLKFVSDWDPSRTPWSLTLSDVRLRSESPAAAKGPDLDRIPSPPRARTQ